MPVLRATAPGWVADAASHLRRGAPHAGGCRVLAMEGRSGSGKTSLADLLAAELGCPVIRMDDLYPGWEGLAASVPLLRDWVLAPLRQGGSPRWRRYDWDRGAFAEWQETPVGSTLLVEGCGSGAAQVRPYLSALAWVEAPEAERERRLAERWDADLYAPYRETWARQEAEYYAEHRPCLHADLVIDNTEPVA